MIKKEYHNPTLEIITLTEADVICASLLSHNGINGEVISDKFNQKWLEV